MILVLIAAGTLPRLRRHRELQASSHEVLTSAPLVNIVKPVAAPPDTELVLPGSIQAMEETSVNAQTSGYISAYYADIGSHVHAGQLLAEIESPEVDQQVLGAQSDVVRARAQLGQSQANVSRLQAGVAQANAVVLTGEANLQQARANVASLQAKALQAQAAVSAARAGLAEAKGVLSQRLADQAHAQVNVELAAKTLDRWKELGKVNAVSGQEVDEKQADYDGAVDNLSAAGAGVDAARDNVDAAATQVQSALADAQAAGASVDAARQQVHANEAEIQSDQAGMTAAKADVDAGDQDVQAAAADIGSKQAGARQYSALQGFQRIVAPFDGVITARNIDVGTLVSSGATPGKELDPTRTVQQSGLFGIARIDTLRIQANVPQSFVQYLHNGEIAQVTVPEFGGKVFSGHILVMSGALDADSRTMLVEVDLPNPTGELLPGMYVQVHFMAKRTAPAWIIPANALIVDASGVRVASVTSGNQVQFLPVQVAEDHGSTLDIASGLSGSETLITDPADDLVDGETVQIKSAAPKPASGSAPSGT